MNKQPQANTHAQHVGHGRAWVESITGDVATIRYDADTGTRSRAKQVAVASLDFNAPNGWKVLKG